MRLTTINGKAYTVERVFNMVVNYHFTDKRGVVYLVDGEDVGEWADDQGMEWDNGEDMAIRYAQYYADADEHGVFWWKVKGE